MMMYTTFVLLAVTIILQIISLLNVKSRKMESLFGIITPFLLMVSGLLLLTELILRSIEIRFVAVTNTFESLLFFSMMIAIVLAVYAWVKRKDVFRWVIFGGALLAFILLSVASSPIAPKEMAPPIPALQSNWLVLHVTLAFIGEAFFAVAFISSLYLLLTKDEDKKRKLDRLTYTTIAIGYPIFTAGALLFGAIWASYAWGRFWGWDPKETWALVTWLTYTGYLHFRVIRKSNAHVTAWLSVIGFIFTLFTFFGVNFLLSGLHSYG
jgi:ABC-type transport system involved in cytochrome c biogenesis permease subunit